MRKPNQPYFYLRASQKSREITRSAGPLGEASICFPLPDGGWIDYTLSLTGGNEPHVVFSSRTNRDVEATILARVRQPLATEEQSSR